MLVVKKVSAIKLSGRIKIDSLLLLPILVILIYFVLCNFGYFGEIKDRNNYSETFNNLNGAIGFLSLFGLSSFYTLLLVSTSQMFLSIVSLLLLLIKIFFLKRILKLNIFVLLYLFKFSFVIDLILLKESLALTLLIVAYTVSKKAQKAFLLVLSVSAHVAVVPYVIAMMRKKWLFILLVSLFVILMFFSGWILDIPYIVYYTSKFTMYFADISVDSVLYNNPLYWLSIVVVICALMDRVLLKKTSYDFSFILVGIFSVLIGSFHLLLGAPAFRLWQFCSTSELFIVGMLSKNIMRIMLSLYFVVAFSFWFYSSVYLKGFLV